MEGEETQEDENMQISELVNSYLTAADDLADELKKDETLNQTVTLLSENMKSDKPVVEEEEYLDSLTVEEKKTAVSYEELLQSYQIIFKKWQAAGIRSQLQEMKTKDLEIDVGDLKLEIMKVNEEKESLKLQVKEMDKKNNNSEDEIPEQRDGSRWKETLKELEEKKTMYNMLKETKEELSIYKNQNELLEEEVRKLKLTQEEGKRISEAELKKELMVLGKKMKDEHDEELREKDEKLQISHENVEELLRRLRKVERESEEKEEEIEILKGEVCKGETKTRLLQENLSRVTDENIQMKNKNKVVSDTDINKVYRELQDFKKDISKQIKDLSDIHKKREVESKKSGGTKETLRENQEEERQDQQDLSDINKKREVEIKKPGGTKQTLRENQEEERQDSQQKQPQQTMYDEQQIQEQSLQQQQDVNVPSCTSSSSSETLSLLSHWDPDQHEPNLERNIVPGVKLYSKSHLRSTMVITDSMAGRVNKKQINRNIDSNEEEVIFKRFPGHTADELSYYAHKPLRDEKPNQVIVIAGTNDIGKEVDLGRTVNEHEVVENIMKIGRVARDTGADKVYVSSIMVRHGYQYKHVIKRVNNLLESACSEEGFWYLDQSDITSSHIGHDGVHLNFFGQTLLKMSILGCFSSFNPYFTDFEHDYDKSLF